MCLPHHTNWMPRKTKFKDNQIVKQENRVLDDGFKIENNHIITSKFSINDGYQFNEIGSTNLDQVNTPAFYRKSKRFYEHTLIVRGKYKTTPFRKYI